MAMKTTRRIFMKGAAASALAAPYLGVGNILGANEKLNFAAIGAGGRGPAPSSPRRRCFCHL